MTKTSRKTYSLIGRDGKSYQSPAPGTLGGHRPNRGYGRLDCPSALRWIERGHYVKHRDFFADEETAIAAGYRPCAVCMPREYATWKAEREASRRAGMRRAREKLSADPRAAAAAALSRSEMVERMLSSDWESDGTFIVGVKTTGIYCLPSCRPPRKPKPENCDFFATPLQARAAGFRPCKLCEPDGFHHRDPNDKAKAPTPRRGETMNARLDTAESPAGLIAFATDDEGALLGLRFLEGTYPLTLEEELERDGFVLRSCASEEAATDGPTVRSRKEISEYFAGDRWVFDVPLVLRGLEFQKAVWKELSRIPFGETRTYAEVSRLVGRPKSARAVGRANATNRIPLVIPCHRVIGADGTLTGFGAVSTSRRGFWNTNAGC